MNDTQKAIAEIDSRLEVIAEERSANIHSLFNAKALPEEHYYTRDRKLGWDMKELNAAKLALSQELDAQALLTEE